MTEPSTAPATTCTPKLAAALAKAQGEFRPIAKNRAVQIYSTKGSYSFRYADLEELFAATRPALAANGLSVLQEIKGNLLRTVLLHESGEERWSEAPLSSGGDDIKQYGARITYLRRYQYSSLLCLAADDDLDEDGEAAGPVTASKSDRPSVKKPESDGEQKAAPVDGPRVTASQINVIRAKCKQAGIDEATLCNALGAPSIEELPAAQANAALDKIKGFAAAAAGAQS